MLEAVGTYCVLVLHTSGEYLVVRQPLPLLPLPQFTKIEGTEQK